MRLGSDKLFLMSIPFIWMTICIVAAKVRGVLHQNYFTVGPSTTLLFADMPVDTWAKWGALVGFLVITKILETGTIGIVGPWITTQVQDENRRDLPYAKWKCNLIVLMFTLYMGIARVIDILCVLAQVDIALIELTSELVVIQCWILPQWTHGKTGAVIASWIADNLVPGQTDGYLPYSPLSATDDDSIQLQLITAEGSATTVGIEGSATVSNAGVTPPAIN